MIKIGPGRPERRCRAAKPVVVAWLALVSIFLRPAFAQGAGNQSDSRERPDPPSLLAVVVTEVKELGRHPGEDFYRWEFFLGEDDDDTNKDIHAVIVIQEDPPPLRLRIHVTYLKRLPGQPPVRIAEKTRTIFAAQAGVRLAVEKSDYADKELVPLLQSLLKAIRDKKRLLRRAVPPPTS